MDTAVIDEGPFDQEGLIIEAGEVVGETAVLDTDRWKLQATGGNLPASVQAASFKPDDAFMLKAACVASYLIVEFENDRDSNNVGTAFFLDREYLVTAGHCLVRANDTIKQIFVVQPGLPYINYTKLTEGEYNLVKCTLVQNFYSGKDNEEADFALLRAQGFLARCPPPFSMHPPPVDATVDVIGYPADLTPAMLKGQKLNDIDRSLDEVQKLLPKRTLTASRGVVQSSGSVITYTLSTVPGMSGSCVLYEGKVIGNLIPMPF